MNEYTVIHVQTRIRWMTKRGAVTLMMMRALQYWLFAFTYTQHSTSARREHQYQYVITLDGCSTILCVCMRRLPAYVVSH